MIYAFSLMGAIVTFFVAAFIDMREQLKNVK